MSDALTLAPEITTAIVVNAVAQVEALAENVVVYAAEPNSATVAVEAMAVVVVEGLAGTGPGETSTAWDDITGKPVTLAGYGITDAAPAVHGHAIAQVSGLQAAIDAKLDDTQATPAGLALLGAADAAAQRSALALGSAAQAATMDFAPASHVGVGGAAHAAATPVAAGFMSAGDKAKLDGVAASATNTPLGSSAPAALGAGAAGSSSAAARADHVHPLPTPAALGAAAATHTHDASAIVSGTIDPARLPVFPSTVQIVAATIAGLTTGEQSQVGDGSLVTTTDGRRWIYTGAGSKTDESSYIVLADVTPEWGAISGRPTTLAGYGITDAAPAAHGHAIAQVSGLQAALDAKLDDTQATPAGLALLGAADASAQRSALALGSAAQSATTAFEVAGAVTAHVAAGDPHPQYLTAAEGDAATAAAINALRNQSNTWQGMQSFAPGGVYIRAQGGREGGEMYIERPPQFTDLTSDIVHDSYQNDLRWHFTFAGNLRIFRLRLSEGIDGGAVDLWHTGTLARQYSGADNNAFTDTSPVLARNWHGANQPSGFHEVIHIPGVAGTAHALQIAYFGGDVQNYWIRHRNDTNGWGGMSATWRFLFHSGNLTFGPGLTYSEGVLSGTTSLQDRNRIRQRMYFFAGF